MPPGSYKSAAIILLTDGRRTTGPDPMDAARMAADHGVRVFTVGFGSNAGGSVGYRRHVHLHALRRGDAEGHRRHHASASTSTPRARRICKKIYEGLNTKFALERKETEISALFAAAAALLAVASAVLSLLWFNRLV